MGCNVSKYVAAAPPQQKAEVLSASTQSASKNTPLSAQASGEKKKDVVDWDSKSEAERISKLADEDGNGDIDIADNVTLTVSFLNGNMCSIVTRLDATLGDLKAKISKETGHSPWSQRLSLGATPLTESSKPLKDLGVTGASLLSLVVVREPIGQSSLEAPDGKKENIFTAHSHGRFPKEVLNEFEFMSWQAVCAAHKSHRRVSMGWDEDSWPDLGAWGADLYWTTRSDGCRYEYWSSAPGDNENGVLVRIDTEAMTVIGSGSDDGLEIFEECDTSGVIDELILEGWPRPKCWKRDESDDDDEESDEDDE